MTPASAQQKQQPTAIEIFELRAWARAELWSIGVLDLHDAVDRLALEAERDGISIVEAQAIMASEFGRVRCF